MSDPTPIHKNLRTEVFELQKGSHLCRIHITYEKEQPVEDDSSILGSMMPKNFEPEPIYRVQTVHIEMKDDKDHYQEMVLDDRQLTMLQYVLDKLIPYEQMPGVNLPGMFGLRRRR